MARQFHIQELRARVNRVLVRVYREQGGWTWSTHGPVKAWGARFATVAEAKADVCGFLDANDIHGFEGLPF